MNHHHHHIVPELTDVVRHVISGAEAKRCIVGLLAESSMQNMDTTFFVSLWYYLRAKTDNKIIFLELKQLVNESISLYRQQF